MNRRGGTLAVGAGTAAGLRLRDLVAMLAAAWSGRLLLDLLFEAGAPRLDPGGPHAVRELLSLGCQALALAVPILVGAWRLGFRPGGARGGLPLGCSWGLVVRLLVACMVQWQVMAWLGAMTGWFTLRLTPMPEDPGSWLRLVVLGGLELVLYREILQRGLAPRLGGLDAFLIASLLAAALPLDPLLWIRLRCGDPLPWPAWWTVVQLQARACVALLGPCLATGWVYRRTGRLGPTATFHFTWYLGLAVAGSLPGVIPWLLAGLGLALVGDFLVTVRG